MNRSGFTLLGIILALAIITLIASGGFYFKGLQSPRSTIETGLDAEKKAKEVVEQINKQDLQKQNVINKLSDGSTSTTNVSK